MLQQMKGKEHSNYFSVNNFLFFILSMNIFWKLKSVLHVIELEMSREPQADHKFCQQFMNKKFLLPFFFIKFIHLKIFKI